MVEIYSGNTNEFKWMILFYFYPVLMANEGLVKITKFTTRKKNKNAATLLEIPAWWP